jgi:D-alanyl-D-alanine dipeptidase
MPSNYDARETLVAAMLGAALTALAATWWLWSAH